MDQIADVGRQAHFAVQHGREYGKVPILLEALRIAGMMHALQGRPDLAASKYTAAWDLTIEKKH